MKTAITIIGIILIIIGITGLAYKGLSYKSQEQVAQLGDIKITSENQNRIYFPPILGGASLAVGIILIFIGRNKMK